MRKYYGGVIPKEQCFNVQLGGKIYGINDSVEQDLRTNQFKIKSFLYAGDHIVELPCSSVQAMGAALFIAALLVAAIWATWRTRRKRPA